ncbi:MAG: peptidylprolyl isomerase, partial [Usitatibacter sp.]
MQRTLRNLAVALVAGTFAVAAGAQDKAEKAPRKTAAAPSSSGKVVVNGVTIPQSRIDAMNRELSAQGQPDTPERKQAVTEELVNREVIAQAAQKRGLDKNPDIA